MRLINLFVLLLITVVLSPVQAQQFENSLAPAFEPESTRFITVDEAFPFHAYQEGNQLKIDWQVQPGYYLYQSRLSFQSEHVEIKSQGIPNGIPHEDEFFGNVNIFTEPLFVTLTLANASQNATITVSYQGCAKQGFCYPPEKRVIPIDTGLIPSSPISMPAPKVQSEQGRLADALGSNLWSIPLFLILGIGLALTPCVFPMYPIITSIVLGQKKNSRKQSFKLGLIYVQGMAVTYTLLGLVVASAGLQFQALLQSPIILIGFSLLFVILSLSMFGIYTLQMPSTIQTYLNTLSDKQQQGQTLGVFLMGAISGLVCSPCTTAPLSGALLYVAQTGDLLIGGIALYALGLGMGIPLIIIAVFGQQLLPKSGPWMEKVKVLFGFILLAAPIFLLERILPEIWSTGLWSLLGLSLFLWLFLTIRTLSTGRTKRPLLILCSIAGLCAAVLPLGLYGSAQMKAENANSIHFVRIHSLEELNQQLALAHTNMQPVMLDFYADWCVACKEFEKYTFSAAAVQQKLKSYTLLQADVTENSAQDQALLHSLGVLGLPTILFWDIQGNRVTSAKITGFMPAETLIQHAQKHHL